MKKVGINGFGRFGLHLLKYWVDRIDQANFEVLYINDEVLSLDQAFDIIEQDKYVKFDQYHVLKGEGELIIRIPDGTERHIQYTNVPKKEISWLGKPDIVLECSGRYAAKEDSIDYVQGDTKLVAISATSWDTEKTLIYGYNHEEYSPDIKHISYGSCTVNAYVALTDYINKKYGIIDTDFSVIHNLPEYQLKNFDTLNRRFSTVQKSAVNLLPFLTEENFTVNYTIVPYAGVSMLDYRYRVKNVPTKEELLKDLEYAFTEGELKGLYTLDDVDTGPEPYEGTPYSAVIIKETSRVLQDNIYLHGYMDNENSVNRYFDLIQHICSQL